MRRDWLDPKKARAKMAVGVYYFPGGFRGARLHKPAIVELEDGHLVEVPLTLVDTTKDVFDLIDELAAIHAEQLSTGQVLVPPKRLRRKRGWAVKKKRKRSK